MISWTHSSLYQDATAFVHEYTGKQMWRMKTYYDASVRPTQFQEGQKVLLYDPHKKRGQYTKWQVTWSGTFLIQKRLNASNYVLQKLVGRKSFVAHTDRKWHVSQFSHFTQLNLLHNPEILHFTMLFNGSAPSTVFIQLRDLDPLVANGSLGPARVPPNSSSIGSLILQGSQPRSTDRTIDQQRNYSIQMYYFKTSIVAVGHIQLVM